MKQQFPILPIVLGAGVLAGLGLYYIAKRSNPALEAARRQEAALRGTTGGGTLTPPGPIDLSRLTYGRLFVVGAEENASDPLAGQYVTLSQRGVVNGAIRAKPLNAPPANTIAEMNAQERDVPVSRITALRGA